MISNDDYKLKECCKIDAFCKSRMLCTLKSEIKPMGLDLYCKTENYQNVKYLETWKVGGWDIMAMCFWHAKWCFGRKLKNQQSMTELLSHIRHSLE